MNESDGTRELSLHTHNYTSIPLRHGFIIAKLHASIDHDIGRYIKQIAVTESRGREEKVGTALKCPADRNERIHTRECHAWRSRTTCNHYHKYIKSDPNVRSFGSAWVADVIVQFPRHRAGRQTIGDSRYALHGSLVALIESDICPGVARDPRVRKVTRTPTGAYNVRALSQLFVNVNRSLE